MQFKKHSLSLSLSLIHTHTQYRGSFSATYSLLPLAMSTCGALGLDVHALIKELAIRRVNHSSEIYFSEIPASGGGDGSSMSSAVILFCFTSGTFILHA